jgi:hypothetical protein
VRPAGGHIASAECVESLVAIAYGATNVWMERPGATLGAPYTTKVIQHIAAMFACAELVGVAARTAGISPRVGRGRD